MRCAIRKSASTTASASSESCATNRASSLKRSKPWAVKTAAAMAARAGQRHILHDAGSDERLGLPNLPRVVRPRFFPPGRLIVVPAHVPSCVRSGCIACFCSIIATGCRPYWDIFLFSGQFIVQLAGAQGWTRRALCDIMAIRTRKYNSYKRIWIRCKILRL